MKVALWIVGGLVGLLLLYLLLRPTPTVYPTASSYSGGTWGNLGRLLGSAIGTAAGSYASAPRVGSPGYGPGNIAWQPSAYQQARSYNSISPGGGYSVTPALTPGWGWSGQDQTDIMNYRGSTAYPTANNSAGASGDLVDLLWDSAG